MSIPLLLPNRKVVGEIVGEVAYLPITSKNFLAVGKGFSIDDGVLKAILTAGCSWIDFYHKRKLQHLRVRVETFRANAKSYSYGYGLKWAAPMDCYEQGAGA